MSADTETVLACYPADCRAANVLALGSAGGYSGAAIWKLDAPRGMLALRRWPREHPSPRRLAWIHDVVEHAARHGFERLPLPIATTDGRTFVHHAGRLWELAPWLPGAADYHARPSRKRLENAMTALARFHRSVETFEQIAPQRLPSPGAIDRRVRIAKLLAGEREEISAAIESRSTSADIIDIGRRWMARFPEAAAMVVPLLDEAAALDVVQQPCLRDVWSDHILFAGDEVTGILDLGAMRVESVATDVARLLGSLVGDDAAGRRAGLRAYQAVRPLDDRELRLATAIDRGNVVLSGLVWLRWLLVEGRQFDDVTAIVERLRAGLVRLESLVRREKPTAFGR